MPLVTVSNFKRASWNLTLSPIPGTVAMFEYAWSPYRPDVETEPDFYVFNYLREDHQGNLLVAGYNCLFKLDTQLNILWARRLGITTHLHGFDIDLEGNTYFVSQDAYNGAYTENDYVHITKIDTHGVTIWNRRIQYSPGVLSYMFVQGVTCFHDYCAIILRTMTYRASPPSYVQDYRNLHVKMVDGTHYQTGVFLAPAAHYAAPSRRSSPRIIAAAALPATNFSCVITSGVTIVHAIRLTVENASNIAACLDSQDSDIFYTVRSISDHLQQPTMVVVSRHSISGSGSVWSKKIEPAFHAASIIEEGSSITVALQQTKGMHIVRLSSSSGDFLASSTLEQPLLGSHRSQLYKRSDGKYVVYGAKRVALLDSLYTAGLLDPLRITSGLSFVSTAVENAAWVAIVAGGVSTTSLINNPYTTSMGHPAENMKRNGVYMYPRISWNDYDASTLWKYTESDISTSTIVDGDATKTTSWLSFNDSAWTYAESAVGTSVVLDGIVPASNNWYDTYAAWNSNIFFTVPTSFIVDGIVPTSNNWYDTYAAWNSSTTQTTNNSTLKGF